MLASVIFGAPRDLLANHGPSWSRIARYSCRPSKFNVQGATGQHADAGNLRSAETTALRSRTISTCHEPERVVVAPAESAPVGLEEIVTEPDDGQARRVRASAGRSPSARRADDLCPTSLRSDGPEAARQRGMPPLHRFYTLPFACFSIRPQVSIISSNGVAGPKIRPDSTIFR